jgi:hypothetical protein
VISQSIVEGIRKSSAVTFNVRIRLLLTRITEAASRIHVFEEVGGEFETGFLDMGFSYRSVECLQRSIKVPLQRFTHGKYVYSASCSFHYFRPRAKWYTDRRRGEEAEDRPCSGTVNLAAQG